MADPSSDADFDLDLDRVFLRDPASAAVSDKPMQAKEEKKDLPSAVSPAPPTATIQNPENAGPGHLSRRNPKTGGTAVAGMNRYFMRPSVVTAASAATDAALDSETAGQVAPAQYVKKRTAESLPDLKPNKAHSILAGVHEGEEKLFAPDERHAMQFIRIALMITLLGLIGYLLFKYFDIGMGSTSQTKADSAPKAVEEAPEQIILNAKNKLVNYLTADSVEAKLAQVLEPERMRPAMQRYVNGGRRDPRVEISSIKFSGRKQIGDGIWIQFQMQHAGSALPITAQVRKLGPEYALDWEHFVMPGAKGWESFIAEKPYSPQQMRVALTRGNVFGTLYHEAEFDCYELTHASGPPTLYGYVKKTDRGAQSIKENLNIQGPTNLSVYLRFEPHAGPQQVRIDDLVTDWNRF